MIIRYHGVLVCRLRLILAPSDPSFVGLMSSGLLWYVLLMCQQCLQDLDICGKQVASLFGGTVYGVLVLVDKVSQTMKDTKEQ